MKRLILFAVFMYLQGSTAFARSYYFSAAGRDDGDGTKAHPFKTLQRLNTLPLKAGDTVFLEAGATFKGSLQPKPGTKGSAQHPIVITPYGKEKATIDGGNGPAIVLYQSAWIHLLHLDLKGAGRKDGNKENGLVLNTCRHIDADDLVISGFQKAGLYIYRSGNVSVRKVFAHDNGYAGISAEGPYGTRDCDHIRIDGCRAENNPGDPSNLSNHSGNGIVVGYCRQVIIEKCTATNNGWDMPRIGNGPVGIWAYESDSVRILHCISFRNKTAKGADDGGGFDLDGGMTHSEIAYCLTYENEGSGFGIFQYAGAAPWTDNSIHDCVSNNDGLVSAARAGVYIWNSSRDPKQFRSCSFYNNVVYNTKGAAINFAGEDEHMGFRFYNNAFITTDSLLKGHPDPADVFENNHWTGLLPDNSLH